MDGIDRIINRINSDVQSEIDQINDEAEKQADDILKSYETRAEREYNDIIVRGKKAADQRLERLDSVAKLEAKKMILSARQEMIKRSFDAALEQLTRLPDDKMIDFLARLAKRAAVSKKESVILSKNDRARIGDRVVNAANRLLDQEEGLVLSQSTRDILGGLILEGQRTEVNCSFETLIRMRRETMAADVAAALFDEKDQV